VPHFDAERAETLRGSAFFVGLHHEQITRETWKPAGRFSYF